MYDRKFLSRAACAASWSASPSARRPRWAAQPATVHKAKISMSRARAIALKAYPGKIVKEELERERGGSGLRYSFDMRRGKQWREVGVDAMTGRVLENTPRRRQPEGLKRCADGPATQKRRLAAVS